MQAERQRMLREAAHLKGYLPKGLLHNMEELSLLEGGSPAPAAVGPAYAPNQQAPASSGFGWQGFGAEEGWTAGQHAEQGYAGMQSTSPTSLAFSKNLAVQAASRAMLGPGPGDTL